MTADEAKAAIGKLADMGFRGGPAKWPGVDFIARDHGDGRGPRVEWLSDKPCPFPEMIEFSKEPDSEP